MNALGDLGASTIRVTCRDIRASQPDPALVGRLRGLTIKPGRLTQIRNERRPGSKYAKLEQCRWELEQADKLFRREGIAVQSTTHTSIEEIASKILSQLGIEKHMF